MPAERCGDAYEASALSGLGGVCCWRPTRNDTDRCIWHADVGRTPTMEPEAAAPKVGERLDGAILRDVTLSDADWLAGRVFDGARFVNCHLEAADLEDSDVRYAHFEGVDAQHADFRSTSSSRTSAPSSATK